MALGTASDEKRVEEAQQLAKKDPQQAEKIYQELLANDPGSSDAGLRIYELALMGLGELYRDQRYKFALPALFRKTLC